MMKKTKTPALAVDIIVEKGGKILILRRNTEPFRGRLEIPGGLVEYGETVEEAAVRETLEESGLKIRLKEILGVYSDPRRDPRGHIASIAFIAAPIGNSNARAADGEASEAMWLPLAEIKKLIKKKGALAFDHVQILADYLKWRRVKKGTYWSKKK